jgi:hypothetical protein
LLSTCENALAAETRRQWHPYGEPFAIRNFLVTRQTPPHRRRSTRRRGLLTAELVLTLPILMVVILGLFEITWLFYARGMVVEASRLGARKATLPGVDLETVQAEVNRMLPARFVSHARVRADLGEHSGDVVSVAVAVPMRSVAPDLLWPIGFTLAGRNLYSETRMGRE